MATNLNKNNLSSPNGGGEQNGSGDPSRSSVLNLAFIGAQFFQGRLMNEPSLMDRVIGQCDEQPLREALEVAKKFIRLAGEPVPDMIAAHQTFEGDEPISVDKVAAHFEGRGWTEMSTSYLVKKVIESLMQKADDEIREQKRRLQNVTKGTLGVMANLEDMRDKTERLLEEFFSSTCPSELLQNGLSPVPRETASLMIENVRQILLRMNQEPAHGWKIHERGFAEAFGIGYDTYRGAARHGGDVSPGDLRDIVWALQARYELHCSEPNAISRIRGELSSIGPWLMGHENFKDVEDIFVRTLQFLGELEEIDPAGDRQQNEDDKFETTLKMAGEALSLDIAKLASNYGKLALRQLLQCVNTKSASDAISSLCDRNSLPDISTIFDPDDVELYRSLPDCAQRVLAWLSGEPVKPATFHAFFDMLRFSAGFDGSLRRMISEFISCIEELEACLHCSALGDVSLVHDELVGLRQHFTQEKGRILPFTEEIRDAGTKRGNEILDGVCREGFKLTGKIRPRLIFKYAADIGMKSCEQAPLVYDRARLTLAPKPKAMTKMPSTKKAKV